jgi:hypothetical protein
MECQLALKLWEARGRETKAVKIQRVSPLSPSRGFAMFCFDFFLPPSFFPSPGNHLYNNIFYQWIFIQQQTSATFSILTLEFMQHPPACTVFYAKTRARWNCAQVASLNTAGFKPGPVFRGLRRS